MTPPVSYHVPWASQAAVNSAIHKAKDFVENIRSLRILEQHTDRLISMYGEPDTSTYDALSVSRRLTWSTCFYSTSTVSPHMAKPYEEECRYACACCVMPHNFALAYQMSEQSSSADCRNMLLQ